MGEDEGGPVLTIEIPAQLQSAVALGTVHKDRDGEEAIPNRPLAIGEDRPGRHRELIFASRAFPERARREGIDLDASAARAIRLAVVVGPADRDEPRVSFLIRHARHGAEAQRPCGGSEEEVLRHRHIR